jgi:hypothetical protein
MKKFLHFFESNGLLKIIGSFLLLSLIVWVGRDSKWVGFDYLALIPLGYLCLSFLIFFGAAIIGTIHDIKEWRKK